MLTNWSGSVRHTQWSAVQPRSVDDLRELVDRPGRLRVVGAGHSFTPVAATPGTLINLDLLSGLVAVTGTRARFHAGTRLRDIPGLLAPHGLALPNQGDVNPQSIAGAVSTGTHGTGLAYTGFAGMVTAMTVLRADGQLEEISEEHPEFTHYRLHLGLLGILVEVEIQCVPAFDLIAHEEALPLNEVLSTFVERARTHDHVEFYWFPHTESVLLKTNTRVEHGAPSPAGLGHIRPRNRFTHILSEEVLDNGALRVACEIGSRIPSAVPAINRLATRLASGRRYRAAAHDVFVSPRRVRFNEMEYAVPIEEAPALVRDIRQLIDDRQWRISFPIEVRVAAADDVALSTAFGRTTAYIAVHRFARDPYRDYFAAVEDRALAVGGRPHWGKMHRLRGRDLASRYPLFAEFTDLVRQEDPGGRFRSPYFDRLLFS